MAHMSGNRDKINALAVETSGAIGSIALGTGSRILATNVFDRPRAHAVEFFPAIELLCRNHGIAPGDIHELYVSSGPGSFTGLRIGITAVRTIAFATGARIVAVPTLEVIAQNAAEADPPPETLAVILDAKRRHVYTAVFHREASNGDSGAGAESFGYVPLTDPVEAEPKEFLAVQDRSCAVLGEGVLYHREAIERSGLRVLPESAYRPRAEIVYRLGRIRAAQGEFSEPRLLIPTYIRPPEAEEKWAKAQKDH